MGCTSSSAAKPPVENTTSPVQQEAVAPPPEATAEEKAVAQLKMMFEALDLDADQTVDRVEFQKAMENNDKIGVLIAEANFNPDAKVLEQLDTNKDGRISWSEFESHLKKAAITQVEETGKVAVAFETGAEKRLKDLFDTIGSYKDDTVLKDELVPKLKETATEDPSFIDLVKEAGLQTDWVIVDQLVADKDGWVTWMDFYAKLKENPPAVVEDKTSKENPPAVIEDETSAKSNCC